MPANTFNLNDFNDAMFITCHDETAKNIAEQGFSVLNDTTQRHLRFCDNQFGSTTKGELLGVIIDDISREITNPKRYQYCETK